MLCLVLIWVDQFLLSYCGVRDVNTKEIRKFANWSLCWSYRNSLFQEERYYLSLVLHLTSGWKSTISIVTIPSIPALACFLYLISILRLQICGKLLSDLWCAIRQFLRSTYLASQDRSLHVNLEKCKDIEKVEKMRPSEEVTRTTK